MASPRFHSNIPPPTDAIRVTSNLVPRRLPEPKLIARSANALRNQDEASKERRRGLLVTPNASHEKISDGRIPVIPSRPKLLFCGGPLGTPMVYSRGAPLFPQRRNTTSLRLLKDDYPGSAPSVMGNVAGEIGEAISLQLPSQRVDDLCGRPFSVGQRVPVRPTALAIEDLTFGCYLNLEDGPDLAGMVDRLRRDMLEFYWPKARNGLSPIGESGLVVGNLVAVNLPGANWFYRGVILAGFKTVNVNVLLIDTGISVNVRTTCLFPLLRPFNDDPPLTVTCFLPGLTPPPPTINIDVMHARLKGLFAVAKRSKSKVEAVICQVVRRQPRHPNIRACVLLEVMILVDGVDVAVKLAENPPPADDKPPDLLLDCLIPPDEAEHHPESFVTNFNGLDCDQFHFERIEQYSF